MVGAMAARPVGMTPAIVARQQLIKPLNQVQVRTSAELHDHDAGSRVRHEDIEESVALAIDEVSALARDVEQAALATRVNGDAGVLHAWVVRL